jgi:uncharacterized membrane protein
MRGHRDLRLVTAAAAACALLALVLPVEVLSLVFMAPLAFFLPGYAVVSAIFVRARLVTPVMLTLAIGTSLSILALGALVLNYAPGGVRGLGWAILLVGLTAAACRLAAIRRPSTEGRWHPSWHAPNRSQAAFLVAAVVVAAGALALAFVNFPADQAIGYTELWMQPYAAGGKVGVRVGVGSNEQHRTVYELRVRIKRGGPTVRRFALEPGESRVLRVASAQIGGGGPERAAAVLLRPYHSDRPYRRVSGWTPPVRALR